MPIIAWSVDWKTNTVVKVLTMMGTKFHIDRHFLFLHGRNLAVFAERVLRKTQENVYIPNREDLWEALNKSCVELNLVLDNPELKRKIRTDALRETESDVFLALGQLATYIEEKASCKSDVFTTGFRPHAEHRKRIEEGVETRRRQRVLAKIAKLEEE